MFADMRSREHASSPEERPSATDSYVALDVEALADPRFPIHNTQAEHKNTTQLFDSGKDTHDAVIEHAIKTRSTPFLADNPPFNRLNHSWGWRTGSALPTILTAGMIVYLVENGLDYFTTVVNNLFYTDPSYGQDARNHDVVTSTSWLSYGLLCLAGISVGYYLRYEIDEARYVEDYSQFVSLMRKSPKFEDYDARELLQRLIEHSTFLLNKKTKHGAKALGHLVGNIHKTFFSDPPQPELPDLLVFDANDDDEVYSLTDSGAAGATGEDTDVATSVEVRIPRPATEFSSVDIKHTAPTTRTTETGAATSSARPITAEHRKIAAEQKRHEAPRGINPAHVADVDFFLRRGPRFQLNAVRQRSPMSRQSAHDTLRNFKGGDATNFLNRLDMLQNEIRKLKDELKGPEHKHHRHELDELQQTITIDTLHFMSIWMFAIRQHMSHSGVQTPKTERVKFLQAILADPFYITKDASGAITEVNELALGEIMYVYFDYHRASPADLGLDLSSNPEHNPAILHYQREQKLDQDVFLSLNLPSQELIVNSIYAFMKQACSLDSAITDSRIWNDLLSHSRKNQAKPGFFARLFRRTNAERQTYLNPNVLAATNPETQDELFGLGDEGEYKALEEGKKFL